MGVETQGGLGKIPLSCCRCNVFMLFFPQWSKGLAAKKLQVPPEAVPVSKGPLEKPYHAHSC